YQLRLRHHFRYSLEVFEESTGDTHQAHLGLARWLTQLRGSAPMRRLRSPPARTCLSAAAALITALQSIGWQRVGNATAAGARAIIRTTEPAIALGRWFLLPFSIGAPRRRWGSHMTRRIREHMRHPGQSWIPGLPLTACLALGLLLACVLVFPRL